MSQPSRDGGNALHGGKAILIVDDHLGTCETFGFVFARAGLVVRTAASGAEALELARSFRFDLLLVDLRLPDMSGNDLVRALKQSSAAPFILFSAFLTTEITVEAMKLGAFDVIDKFADIDNVCGTVLSAIGNRVRTAGGGWRAILEAALPAVNGRPDMRPGSTAEVWATYVLKAVDAKRDLATVAEWAAHVRSNRSSVSDSCTILGIPPRNARDLARLLRAFMQGAVYQCQAEAFLLASDKRTLETLLQRGGLAPGMAPGSVSVEEFLDRQQFVDGGNGGLKALRRLILPSN